MITIKHLNKSFDKLHVFRDYSMKINNGEIVCLLGPSGCGKSTLLKILAGLDKSYTGTIDGLENTKISYVFQEPRLIPWLTVRQNLDYVLQDQIDAEKLDSYIVSYIEQVKLSGFLDVYPNTLSGGMKQRVALARAFAMPHDLLLLDEPFQGLDYELKYELITLLEELIAIDKKTVIMVTHDREEANRLADRIITIENLNSK